MSNPGDVPESDSEWVARELADEYDDLTDQLAAFWRRAGQLLAARQTTAAELAAQLGIARATVYRRIEAATR